VPATILFLHSSAGAYGADRQLLLLAAGLEREAFRPLVVLPERGTLAEELEAAEVEVITRPLAVVRRDTLGPRGLARLATATARDRGGLGRLARQREVALVHANTSVLPGAPVVADAAGARLVVHVREIYAGAPAAVAWPAWQRVLLGADALLCVSEAAVAQFGRAPHAHVVHDGLPRVPERRPRAEARAALKVPADAFVVALLGRLSDWKGQDLLLEALADPELARLGTVALLAGDPFPGAEQVEGDLVRLRDRLALGPRARLLGFRADVETVLGAADAVAVPSTRPDPLPNSALEGAAAGLPVVAAAHGGLPEIVRNGETGLLVPPGDPRALAAALADLGGDPGRREAMGAAAAADVRERFAPERMLEAVQERYERLLGALS
jgi:glycosyltransferase involved in cell wall biosynthesis